MDKEKIFNTNIEAETEMTLASQSEQTSDAPKENAGKHGAWIRLGHRMGACKHSDSIDYKCSLCGYEQYTVWGFGLTETCPECGAFMEMMNLCKWLSDHEDIELTFREYKDTIIIKMSYIGSAPKLARAAVKADKQIALRPDICFGSSSGKNSAVMTIAGKRRCRFESCPKHQLDRIRRNVMESPEVKNLMAVRGKWFESY